MAEKHFFEQKQHAASYLIPYFEKHISNFAKASVLEIGCAEGGFLDVLHEQGVHCTGLELSAPRVVTAKKQNPNMQIYQGDITDNYIIDKIGKTFDLIVMRDTIEHIPDKQSTFLNISKLLKPGGHCYITFPPRYSGFAGHQQVGASLMRLMPYLQLMPTHMIRILGSILNERSHVIDNIISFKKTGLSIHNFEKYCSQFKLKPVVRDLFLFRPIYAIRFHLKPTRLPNIPILREFITLGCEYLLQKSL